MDVRQQVVVADSALPSSRRRTSKFACRGALAGEELEYRLGIPTV
jgi:hypothetical protein